MTTAPRAVVKARASYATRIDGGWTRWCAGMPIAPALEARDRACVDGGFRRRAKQKKSVNESAAPDSRHCWTPSSRW